MSFRKSLINQLGRDTGKVITNIVFNNAHATPVRVTSTNSGPVKKARKKRVKKSEFDRLYGFKMDYTPKTLVRKTIALYGALDNEIEKAIEDQYLDNNEISMLSGLHIKFLNKCVKVIEAINLQDNNDPNAHNILDVAATANRKLAKALELTIEVCLKKVDLIQEKIEEEKPVSIEKFKPSLSLLKRAFTKKHYNRYKKSQEETISGLKNEIVFYENKVESMQSFIDRISKISFKAN